MLRHRIGSVRVMAMIMAMALFKIAIILDTGEPLAIALNLSGSTVGFI